MYRVVRTTRHAWSLFVAGGEGSVTKGIRLAVESGWSLRSLKGTHNEGCHGA